MVQTFCKKTAIKSCISCLVMFLSRFFFLNICDIRNFPLPLPQNITKRTKNEKNQATCIADATCEH